jgi:ABC-type sugar transport system ATPase subunit
LNIKKTSLYKKMAQIILKNLSKNFGKTEVIKNINLTIEDKEFVVFVGPSGCGKSTLLRLIAGLEEVSGGELFIDKELSNEVQPSQRGIAMVFQSYALYPHMTVAENLGFGLKNLKTKKEVIQEKVELAAKKLQIHTMLDKLPRQLSGGQRQRVAIGRSIVRNPRVFLFDEPLSNLDASLRVKMRLEIAKLHQELQNTTIYVTHDQLEAMTLATKIVVLNKGIVEQVGTPLEIYHQPQNLFVAKFIGMPQINLIKVSEFDTKKKMLEIVLPGGQKCKIPIKKEIHANCKSLTLGVRPCDLSCSKKEYFIEAKLTATENLGNELYGYFTTKLEEFLCVTENANNQFSKIGSVSKCYFDSKDCYIFDDNGLCIT